MSSGGNRIRTGWWFIFAAYLVLLHIIVFAALFRPNWIDEQRWRSAVFQPEPSATAMELHRNFRAMDRQISDSRAVLIGDSQFSLFDESLFAGRHQNFAIGGDTFRNMTSRVVDYSSLKNARAVVVWAGYNDLLKRDAVAAAQDASNMLAALPANSKIILVGMAPVGANNSHTDMQRKVVALNGRLAEICKRNCRFVNIFPDLADQNGLLRADYDRGDGIHLNQVGQRVVAKLLNAQLAGGAS